MSRLEIEKVFQYIKMNFGRFMAKITPAWKMRKLHLWWFHEVNGNAFRRIYAINEELFKKMPELIIVICVEELYLKVV